MNWLAHLLLSEPDVESRLGNLLADLVKGRERANLNVNIQRGIKFHQAVDAFTDSHLVVHRSKARISPVYRRFSGILIDGFYDHFLAKNWLLFSNQPLDIFTKEIYSCFLKYQGILPQSANQVIKRMAQEDWLGNYRSLTGIENLLARLAKRFLARFHKSFDLDLAINELNDNYRELEGDFLEFFPELVAMVKI